MNADGSLPAAVAVNDCSGFDQVAQDLTDKEWVAFGLAGESMGEIDGVVIEVVTARLCEQLADPLFADPPKREALDAGFPTEVANRGSQRMRTVDVRVAIRDENHERRLSWQMPDDMA